MNQNPEQLARDRIDDLLVASGWIIQDRRSFNLAAGPGVAIREYATDAGPADYVLFVHRKPVGVIEAKRAEEGGRGGMSCTRARRVRASRSQPSKVSGRWKVNTGRERGLG